MRDETDDIDWSGSEKAAAVGDGLGQRLEKLSKLWEPKEEEGVDLSPGGAESPEGQLKAAFDKASVNPEEVPSVATGDAPKAGEKPPRPTEPWAAIKYDLEQNASRKPSADPLAEKMKAAGWAPKESSPPPDWEALQLNLQHAQDTANATRLGQQSFAAVSNFHADPNAGSAEIAAAKAPLEVAQERQHFEAGQQASQAAQLAAHEKLLEEKKEQDRNDPTSDLSKRAREEMRPILQRAGGVPDNYDTTWTAADVDKHSNLITPIAGQLTQERIAKGHDDAAAAAKAAADKAKADAAGVKAGEEKTVVDALRETAKKSPRLAELGIKPGDLDNLDRKALEEVDRNLRDLPNKKPGGGGGPAKAVTSVDQISDPGTRATVEKILSNKMGLNEVQGSRAYKEQVGKLVAQLGADFDTTGHAIYSKVAQEIANDAKIQNAVNAKQHFARALQNIPDNLDSNSLNKIVNSFQKGTGGAGLSPYESDIVVGAGEMAKSLAENDMHGKEAVNALMDPNQSKEQIQKHLKELLFLSEENLETRRRQFEGVAPKGTPLPALLRREGGDSREEKVRVRRKSDGAAATLSADRAKRLIDSGKYEASE